MQTLSAALVAFAAMIAAAYGLRWRYRTWIVVFLGGIALAAGGLRWAGENGRVEEAPAYAQQAAARLLARPWPSEAADQARLVASFRAIGETREELDLAFLYRLGIGRAAAGDPPLAFATVGDALAWRRLPARLRAGDRAWAEVASLDDRVLASLIDVELPDTAEWPTDLRESSPLKPGSRALGGSLWIAPRGDGSGRNVLQFPVRVNRRGEGRITDAQVALEAYLPRGGEVLRSEPLGRERFACWVALRDFAPGDSRLAKCEIETPHEQSPATTRLVGDVADLRAGTLRIWPHLTVGLDYAPFIAPAAEPVNAQEALRFAELRAMDAARAKRAESIREALRAGLAIACAVLLGFAVPGVLGRGVSAAGVAMAAAGGGVAALATTWGYASTHGGMGGYVPLIVAYIAALADGLFVAGVILGNVVRARAPAPQVPSSAGDMR